MEGTTTLEIEPLLNVEFDFEFIPGQPARLLCHPDLAEPGYDPEYDFQTIRVVHKGKKYQVPDWLMEIITSQYQMELVDIVDEWVDEQPKRNPRRRGYGSRKGRRRY